MEISAVEHKLIAELLGLSDIEITGVELTRDNTVLVRGNKAHHLHTRPGIFDEADFLEHGPVPAHKHVADLLDRAIHPADQRDPVEDTFAHGNQLASRQVACQQTGGQEQA